MASNKDEINHPKHYTSHPSGVECIDIAEHMNFCLGNAVKYIWRAGLKSEDAEKDLEKAIWYLNRELSRVKSGQNHRSEEQSAAAPPAED